MACCKADDDIFPNDWIPSYNQRALLERILYDPLSDKQRPKHVKNVKFFTKDEKIGTRDQSTGTTFSCYHDIIYDLKDFYARLKFKAYFDSFDATDIKNDYWDKINRFVELFQFKYHDADVGKRWTTTVINLNKDTAELFKELTTEQKLYLSAFKGALKCDMKNGQAKMWVEELVKTLLECLKVSKLVNPDLYLNIWSPARYCNTNTTVETMTGDLRNPTTQISFNAPCTHDCSADQDLNLSSSSLESGKSESSTTSSRYSRCESKSKKRIVVPDVCVSLTCSPGIFPLVFELMPAWEESKGYDQNIKQMISKLCFQDVIFGIVVSPRQYQLSVITKNKGEIHILSTATISLYTWKDGCWNLNISALNKMCSFIYQALKWSIKTKCLLETS